MNGVIGYRLTMGELPDAVRRLLWDVDSDAVDLERDARLVIERVMSRGSWEAMQWLLRRYPRDILAEFLLTRGVRTLSPRDIAYWALVCNVDVPVGTGGGRPAWAGQ
jgi:hypothetical protein